MRSEFLNAITQLCSERGLSPAVVLETLEAALVSAYKRDYGSEQNIAVKIHPQTGEIRVYTVKTVVSEVTDPVNEITPEEARKLDSKATVGDSIHIAETTPHNFGRIAAQTAKQVVLQRIREAERENLYSEFIGREGDIVTGIIQRQDKNDTIVLELGRAEAFLPKPEQVINERYRPGQRLKVLLLEVQRTNRAPQLVVSRSHPNLVKRLFELEVPEVFNGLVEIKAIAREPGSRTKVAVAAREEGIDPVGSCVGMRGQRIQNVVNELHDEKIDVIEWSNDPRVLVTNALSPAQVVSVELDEKSKTAKVVVPDRQLSLAIGRQGQNARLAAKLTGWRIDIKSPADAAREAEEEAERRAVVEAEERARAEEEAVVAAEAAAILAAQAPAEAPVAEAPVEEAVAEPVAVEEPVVVAQADEAAVAVGESALSVAEAPAAPEVPATVEEPVAVAEPAQPEPTAVPQPAAVAPTQPVAPVRPVRPAEPEAEIDTTIPLWAQVIDENLIPRQPAAPPTPETARRGKKKREERRPTAEEQRPRARGTAKGGRQKQNWLDYVDEESEDNQDNEE